jgi:hypothetical protein
MQSPNSLRGTSIANEIVERHGGRLAVESTLGIGTTVRLSLPNVAAEKLPSDSDVVRVSAKKKGAIRIAPAVEGS